MYPYLFGIETLKMYDLIGLMGYVILIFYFAANRNRLYLTDESRKKWPIWLLLAVQLVAYTFAGENLGPLVGRGTEFFAFVLVSAVGMVLTAVALGYRPLRWLDGTVLLYATTAAMLKLSCFCSGCCYGMPWARGWYNHRNNRMEFPIQLVEVAAYALLLAALWRYRGREGQRFALFLAGYGAIRFVVQFFRTDVAVFTPFHWMSALFAAVGAVMWVLCAVLPRRKCTDVE